MNLQVKRQSLKIQPKSLNPFRSSLPSKHQNPYSLKQRSFVNYASYTTVNPNVTLKSAKPKLQSKQPYLLQQPIQKNYVSEIQKLSQICQQFYHENQKLKIQLKQQTIRDRQMWKNKVVQLEYQLVKKQQILQNQRKYIEQYQHKMQKNSVKKQNFNNHNNLHAGHCIIVASKSSIQQNTNNEKIQKLMLQLQARQSQIVKYMHKQTQFVQIYVQKQQLLHKIRTLQSTIHYKNKEIYQYKKNDRKQKMDISLSDKYKLQTSQYQDHDSNKDNIKITEYNEKLLSKLKVSGQQIQRLNNFIKIKDEEVKNLKNFYSITQKQINNLQLNVQIMKSREDALLQAVYQKQIKIQCLQCKDKDKLIQQIKQRFNLLQISLYQNTITQAKLQNKTKQLQIQNTNLLARVNDQIEVSLKLREIITKLQQDKNKKINNTNQMKQIQTSTEPSEQVQEKYTQTQQQQIQDYGISQTQIKNRNLDKISKIYDDQVYKSYINSLKQENQHLSNFIMQQSKHISDLRNQNHLLTRSNAQTKQYIQKLDYTDKRFPDLIKKTNYLEQKIQQVRKQYQKILVKVQKSQNQSQNIHKDMQKKLQQLREDLVEVKQIKMNSQLDSDLQNFYKHINQKPFQTFYADSKILQISNMPQSKIKQQKSQNLAQLIIKN